VFFRRVADGGGIHPTLRAVEPKLCR
jgi:hypothetical protein